MRRLVSPFMLLAVLTAGFFVSAPKSANAQSAGLVSSVLNRMERNRQSLRSLKASLSMEKYNAQLRDSDRYSGTLHYVPGAGRTASIRIEWQKPQHEILAVSNDKFTLFRPRLNMAYVGSSKSKKNSAGGLTEMMYLSRQQLEARFQPVQDVREETLWGGVSTIHLTLVPKGNQSFKYAEIWVDGGGMPVQTKIVEKNGDATTMRLLNMERNPRIPGDVFDLKLDSNVKIVKA
ncbi:MAG TPA: outer membrane lipoprotein carrier protein LolA [Pyrinomonadaceae bacterium]|nr:outer membrane lipoprotein carrier protein LolA [Pyrinomonadaceae bacterium]